MGIDLARRAIYNAYALIILFIGHTRGLILWISLLALLYLYIFDRKYSNARDLWIYWVC